MRAVLWIVNKIVILCYRVVFLQYGYNPVKIRLRACRQPGIVVNL